MPNDWTPEEIAKAQAKCADDPGEPLEDQCQKCLFSVICPEGHEFPLGSWCQECTHALGAYARTSLPSLLQGMLDRDAEIERLQKELDDTRILSEHRKTVSEDAQQNWFDSDQDIERLRGIVDRYEELRKCEACGALRDRTDFNTSYDEGPNDVCDWCARLGEKDAEIERLRAGPEWSAFEAELAKRTGEAADKMTEAWKKTVTEARTARDKADDEAERLRNQLACGSGRKEETATGLPCPNCGEVLCCDFECMPGIPRNCGDDGDTETRS